MGWWKSLVEKSKKSLKYSVSDPTNFEEVWSFTSTRIRVISLVVVLVFGLGLGMSFLITLLGGSGLVGGDKRIERRQLEEQYETIEKLSEDLNAHKKYVAAVRRIYSGEIPISSNLDSLAKETDVDFGDVRSELTPSEKAITEKVKDDMRSGAESGSSIPYFKAPVSGVISDGFDKRTHPGIDVVTEKNETIKACLSGIVLYSGFSRQDGYIVILDHGNGFSSVYKHARKSLKKTGDRVQLGDPIAIVGNTGENSTGPHLHFELWYEQAPVNPADYLTFTR